jgi:2,3-bisphosphoglycerate-independent phosphoglycerate mutase
MTSVKRSLALIILDGWGFRSETDNNAIAMAKTPTFDNLWAHRPNGLLTCSGLDVGLPHGQMGNSEVGHVTIGTGRVVYQSLVKINNDIQTQQFQQKKILKETLEACQKSKKNLHIMGLLSPGGVHSHEQHLHAILKEAAQYQLSQVYIHAFLDGRDTPPQSAEKSLQALQALCQQYKCGQIASIMGRYYAMDRDQRWDRTELAYRAIQAGQTDQVYSDPILALQAAYAENETDEFVRPRAIRITESALELNEDAVLIFTNFRADRAIQLTQAFADPEFKHFATSNHQQNTILTMTHYTDQFIPWHVKPIYQPETIEDTLGQRLQQHHKTQLRISETEKYAHVTYFFNGGSETPLPNEDRILIPSPKVSRYDQAPAMNSTLLTDALIEAIQGQRYDVLVCNFPNADMVGHTGNLKATIQACEVIDTCLKRILAALEAVGGQAIITADHGNAEQMVADDKASQHTAHTLNPVPFIYIGNDMQLKEKANKSIIGSLADIAPTILSILEITAPNTMSGCSLLKKKTS